VPIEFEKIWKTVKLRGPRFALLGLGSALIFAVANKLVDNALTNAVDGVSALVSPPTFLVVFSEPINTRELQIIDERQRRRQDIQIASLGDRAIKITAIPGFYLLKIHRNTDNRTLNEPLYLRSTTTDYKIDASDTHWASETETTHVEGTNVSAAPNLMGTRWSTTQVDWDLVGSAPSEKLATIVKTALGQVGVNRNGSENDMRTIVEYFSDTNLPRPASETPWGGAFLNWVMRQSGAPVPRSAAFQSWLTWGEDVPVDKAAPGMITIFDFPGLPQAPSKLLVGIFMRRRAECTEVVVGNIAGRVVITCVTGSIKSVRKPGVA
jgi:uncharacterized protein (TIGR02594 family)